jgi:hypothetical protein
MRQLFTCIYLWALLAAATMSVNVANAVIRPVLKTDTSYLHLQKMRAASSKNSYLKSGLHLSMPPLKAAVTSNIKVNVFRGDDKVLNNVQVYPITVTDQINLKYTLSRNAFVTVKVMDLLGNEVITLLNQRVDTGEKSFTYNLTNKLTSGFYFVRVVAGTESVIRRISVL